MKKIVVYLLFFSLTTTAIVLAGLSSLFFIGLLSVRKILLFNYHFPDGVVAVALVLIAIPLWIFFFQFFQDINYRVIHLTGYWAYSKPKFIHRGLTIPNFYETKLQNDAMRISIKKSKYRYRFLAILQWVITTVVVELVMVAYWYIAERLNLQIHGIIFFILLMGTIYFTLSILERVQKKLNLEIAYVENEREFFYKKSNHEK
jgi:hypothetical protein